MLKYRDPQLYVFTQHWPAMIYLPCVLVLVALLALVTNWWDKHDAERAAAAAARSRRCGPGGAGPGSLDILGSTEGPGGTG